MWEKGKNNEKRQNVPNTCVYLINFAFMSLSRRPVVLQGHHSISLWAFLVKSLKQKIYYGRSFFNSKFGSSVTRWLNYLFNIQLLTSYKNLTNSKKLPSRIIFLPNTFQILPGGEISPNLVTLVGSTSSHTRLLYALCAIETLNVPKIRRNR